MKKGKKAVCMGMLLSMLIFATSCRQMTEDTIKLTIWVSESDKAFATSVADAFKAQHPDKNYQIVIDVQGENDVATRILNDVENAADVFSYSNDQIPKLLNGDALTRIAGDRLSRIREANSEESLDSATIKIKGEEGVYGIPYTDNTFFLYYNKSVLTETDVQSLDGILSKCSSNRQFAYPIADGWYSTAFYFGKELGYEVEYDDNFSESKITCDFDNETGKKVTESIWDYVKDPRFKGDVNDSKITAGFNDGTIVAAVSGIWNRKTIESYLGENFGAAKLPTYTLNKGLSNAEQTQLVSFAGYKLMGINNYSKHKTDALDFAEFYTNKENQVKHFETRGFVPTNKEARMEEKVQSDICAKAITNQLLHSKTQKGVPSTLWIPMEGLGTAMITGMQNGSFDIDAQLKACVEGIEK